MAPEAPADDADEPDEPRPMRSTGGLRVINGLPHGVQIFAPYIAALDGQGGTGRLWPLHTCPEAEYRLLGRGERLLLPPPTVAYDLTDCNRSRLLEPGDYIVKLESGQVGKIYAATTLTLPMNGVVELTFEPHPPLSWPCDDALAQRAGGLALSVGGDAARVGQTLPEGFFAGCDAAEAKCEHWSETFDFPPRTCRITVQPGEVRIDRPAGDDAPRGLTALLDREAVIVHRPDLTRTSASRIEIDDKPVVFAAASGAGTHREGWGPAKLSSMTVKVDNATGRRLAFSVEAVELLIDDQCRWPQELRARPKVDRVKPKSLPKGKSDLLIEFPAQDARQSGCDRYATRARLLVGGQTVDVTAEHKITFRERPPPL